MAKTEVVAEQKIKWHNRAGNFYLRSEDGKKLGRHILPGKRFMAYPHEVPKAFRDTVRPVNEMADDDEELISSVEQDEFKIVKSKEPGLVDVINTRTKKKLNDQPLKKDEAEAVIKQMQG
jgi:hypothetical protein